VGRVRGFLGDFLSKEQLRAAGIGLPFLVAIFLLALVDTRGTITGCILSGAFLVISLVWTGQTLWMRLAGRAAKGTVVAHAADKGGGFLPIVEFTDVKGTIRREEADEGCDARGRPAVGSRVEVWYDPRGRLGCQIVRWSRWNFSLLTGGIGAIFLLLCLRPEQAKAVILYIVSGGFLLFFFGCSRPTLRMRCAGRVVKGTVVAHAAHRGGGSLLIVEFRDKEGRIRREEAAHVRAARRPPDGSCVKVWYDQRGRRSCEIVEWSNWVVPLFTGVIGVIVLLGALKFR
jgi:hypothetical protein